jgi:hypothetical protein
MLDDRPIPEYWYILAQLSGRGGKRGQADAIDTGRQIGGRERRGKGWKTWKSRS